MWSSTTQEITVPIYVEADPGAPPKPLLFTDIPEDDLLGCGVPAEWLNDVRSANEDSLLELADHLPGETAEALLELTVGGTPPPGNANYVWIQHPLYHLNPSGQTGFVVAKGSLKTGINTIFNTGTVCRCLFEYFRWRISAKIYTLIFLGCAARVCRIQIR